VVWEDSQLEVRFPEALKTFNEPELQPFVGGKKVSNFTLSKNGLVALPC